MKFISARQAWHDALYESRDSVLAVAAEKAALSKRGRVANETHPERKGTNGRCTHMLAAGMVQAAINSLPKPLRHFGHVLYSPMANGNDVAIAHGLVWIGSGLDSLPERKRERAYWIALAALNSHKRAVSGRDTMTPGEVCLFVEERLGARVDPCNWVRDWVGIWGSLAKHVDKLDAQALRPVAEVVARERGWRRGPGWRWLEADRDVVAELRAEAYAAQCEAIQARLAARLQRMTEARLAAWSARVRRYAEAYRQEWAEDVLEQPQVHQRYHDRVAAYWSQRERLQAAGVQVA